MLLVLWEYDVRPEAVEEFESLYRADGAWGDLMRQGPGFVSITLWHDRRQPLRYVVADRWTSEPLYDDFIRRNTSAIDALNERSSATRTREHLIGRFDLEE